MRLLPLRARESAPPPFRWREARILVRWSARAWLRSLWHGMRTAPGIGAILLGALAYRPLRQLAREDALAGQGLSDDAYVAVVVVTCLCLAVQVALHGGREPRGESSQARAALPLRGLAWLVAERRWLGAVSASAPVPIISSQYLWVFHWQQLNVVLPSAESRWAFMAAVAASGIAIKLSAEATIRQWHDRGRFGTIEQRTLRQVLIGVSLLPGTLAMANDRLFVAVWPQALEVIGRAASATLYFLMWPVLLGIAVDQGHYVSAVAMTAGLALLVTLSARRLWRAVTRADQGERCAPTVAASRYANALAGRPLRRRPWALMGLFVTKDIRLPYRAPQGGYWRELWVLLATPMSCQGMLSVIGSADPASPARLMQTLLLVLGPALLLAGRRGLGCIGAEGGQVQRLLPVLGIRRLLGIKTVVATSWTVIYAGGLALILLSETALLEPALGIGGTSVAAAMLVSGVTGAALAVVATALGGLVPAPGTSTLYTPGASVAGYGFLLMLGLPCCLLTSYAYALWHMGRLGVSGVLLAEGVVLTVTLGLALVIHLPIGWVWQRRDLAGWSRRG